MEDLGRMRGSKFDITDIFSDVAFEGASLGGTSTVGTDVSKDSALGPSLKGTSTGGRFIPVRSASMLESGFHIRDKEWFKIGRVFTMKWYNNIRSGEMRPMDSDSATPESQRQGIHIGQFAVVRECYTFFWAILISTYSGKGLGNLGFNEEDREAARDHPHEWDRTDTARS